MTKLGLTSSEVGRITMTLFNKLYKHYKDNFDLELRLRVNNVTYEEAYQKANAAEEWF